MIDETENQSMSELFASLWRAMATNSYAHVTF